MTGGRKLDPHDPTAETTANQSTQTASGLQQSVERLPRRPGADVTREVEADDTLYRSDDDTSRRHEDDK